METIDNTRRTLEKRIKNLEHENRQYQKVAPLGVDQGDPHASGLGVLMMYGLYFYFPAKQKGVFLRQSCIIFRI